MWQLSRQTSSSQTLSRQFFETENLLLEKKQGPVKFEPRTFAATGVLVTSRPNVVESQKNELVRS